jgi:hypothetical protein
MYRSFSIANFRGLRSLELDDLGPVNILTGLNDAGKTTVLEAMYLHSSGPLAGFQTIQVIRPSRLQEQLAVGADPENPWGSLFHQFDTSTPIELSGMVDGARYALRLEEPKRGPSRSSAAKTPVGDNLVALNSAITIVETRDSKSKTYTQSLTAKVSNIATNPPTMSVEIGLEPEASQPFRRAALVKPSLGFDLAAGYSHLRKSLGPIDLSASLREIDGRIGSLEVLVSNGRPQLHAEVNGVLVPFQLLGDGPVAMARYLIAMSSVRGGTLLLDEVGAGLHYSLLPGMWSTLFRAAKRLDVQIIATTHSLESITAAADRINDRPHDLTIYRLRRAAPHDPTDVTAFSGAKLATAVDFNTELR